MRINCKILIPAIAASLAWAPALAQNHSGLSSGNPRDSFQEFRKGLLSDFKDFRERLLDQYADFLNGEWHEYESLRGEVRDRTPKPKVVPSVTPAGPSEESPSKPPISLSSPVASDQPSPATIRKPENHGTPKITDSDLSEEFTFYGLPVSIPRIDFNIKQKLTGTQDFGAAWSKLKDDGKALRTVDALKKIAREMNLNDYLLFRLTESYVNSKFPGADASARFSLIHYLLANMGYDIRIAVTSSGRPLLLIPFKEMVYSRTYMNIGGQRYFAFAADETEEYMGGEKIRTCQLPSDGSYGDKFELRLSQLNIPMKPKSFNLSYGPLTLTGEVNENLMPILYHYPQMPMEDFATSAVSPDLRKKLVTQVKQQLSGMEGDEKVETLLKFMHNVFEYSTDEDYHGFEKPYFVEETLYYPKNDCEDRAIFYTWLLCNALGRDAQLISFPGHESASVVMNAPVEGTSYMYDGKKYYISDPTYIGSSTGMVMPSYRGISPEVDYTYHP